MLRPQLKNKKKGSTSSGFGSSTNTAASAGTPKDNYKGDY